METNNTDLPVRFWHYQDLPSDFYRSSMKSNEFKKIYNKNVNPFLKEKGFKVSGFKALKEDDRFYYMVFWGTGKFGGTGCLTIMIQPKELPSKQNSEWIESNNKQPNMYAFRKEISLPNGNKWIDIGGNEEDAKETCDYLVKGLENVYDNYITTFHNKYPQSLLNITSDNFDAEYKRIFKDFGLAFHFEPRFEAALWLSLIHSRNNFNCTQLVEIAKEQFISDAEKNGFKIGKDHQRIKYLNSIKAYNKT